MGQIDAATHVTTVAKDGQKFDMDVAYYQVILNYLSDKPLSNSGFNNDGVTAVYDDTMAEAVGAYQAGHSITPVNGDKIDAQTGQKLVEEFVEKYRQFNPGKLKNPEPKENYKWGVDEPNKKSA